MAEEVAGKGDAHDASVKVSANSPDRPAAVPKHYVWDPELGPIDEITGQPTGAWKEPEDK